MKTVKAMKPIHETFADCCRFEAFSFVRGLSCGLMKYEILGILMFVLFSAGQLLAQPNATLSGTENVLVHPPIAVAVNKAVVIRLPKKATKVAVSQPKIAEVEVVSPDTVVIHGRAIGATSLVIWFQQP